MAKTGIKHEITERLKAGGDGVVIKMELAYSHGIKAATVSRNAREFCKAVDSDSVDQMKLDWDQKIEIAPTEIVMDEPSTSATAYDIRLTFSGLQQARTLFAIAEQAANGGKPIFCKFYQGSTALSKSAQAQQDSSGEGGNGSARNDDDDSSAESGSPERKRGRPRKVAVPPPGSDRLV
jgi:hypothetical protein